MKKEKAEKLGKTEAVEKVETVEKTGKTKKEKKVRKKKRWLRKLKPVLILLLVVAVALGGFSAYKWMKNKKAVTNTDAGTSIVQAGNLTNSISGSGSVEPIEQRDIVPVVKGKIVEAPFAEGDEVKEGDILYRFEMTAATNAIESAQNNVEKAQTNLSNKQSSLDKIRENIDKLTIKATASGRIDGITLVVGEEANGKICAITNYKEQTVTLPFATSQIDSINVGDTASVAVDKYMINTSGTVTRKYTTTQTLSNGAVAHNVEILLSDAYILEEGVSVMATVNNITSASYGSVKYADPVTVNASQRGEVKKINFKNGDWVEKGEVIAILENTDLNDELKNAQQGVKEAEMNLTEAQNNLEDKKEEANEYIVESPIDGVILTKDYEVGDTISGQNSTVMMVVADMSKMKFTISADELDISKIKLGQSVSVTADALTGQRLMGKITAISKLGTSSNGVTNYPIEVTIDEPGDLMPGMNVNANIIIEQAYNTLYLPAEAVEYFGGKYYVTIVGEVENMPERREMPTGNFGGMPTPGNSSSEDGEKKDSSATDDEKKPQREERPTGAPGGYGGQMPARGEGGQMPARGEGGQMQEEANKPQEKTEKASPEKTESKEESKQPQMGTNRPGMQQREELKIKKYAEEKRVEVEIGIITDTYYEIKSGVEYGQVVKNTTQTSSSSRGGFGMGGGMMGGGMGGGMMGGGMPRGNRGGMSGGMGGGMNGGMGGNRNSGGR